MSSSKSLFLKIILKNILFVGNNTRIVDNHDLPDMIVCLIALTSLALIHITMRSSHQLNKKSSTSVVSNICFYNHKNVLST